MPYFDLRDDDAPRLDPSAAPGGDEAAARPACLTIDVDKLPPEIFDEFINETDDLLEECESALLILEAHPENPDAINTVFRGFHTIKGTAACLDLSPLSTCAHHAESLFTRIREGRLKCAGPVADLALECVDLFRHLNRVVTEAMANGSAPLPSSYEDLLRRLREMDQDFEPAETPAPSAPAETEKETLAEEAESPSREPGAPSGEAETSSGETESPSAPAQPSARPASGAGDSIRVRTDRLDRLIEMVGELVLTHSMVAQDENIAALNSAVVDKRVNQASKIIRELHDLSLSMRMVPLSGVFRKVTRVVRDLSQRTGKQVEFVSSGEDTEIDRNMVDLIADPLIHMVRNSLDHGLETPAEREAAGKPAGGTLRLTAAHESGNVVLRLTDDGRGLNREKIVDTAIQKGLIRSGSGMTDAEVYNLLFRPGFSTAKRVTDISGRGVGLDVVRRSIDTLQGRVEVSSRVGEGTTLALRLPLTLAIADGMLIRAGDQRFIIPTTNICMTFRPGPDDVYTVQGRGEVATWRDEILPLLRLSALFGIETGAARERTGLLVVLQDNDQRYALQVDDLLHQQQVVVKSLGRGIGRVYGVSGAAILGDGTVGLILEVSELRTLGRLLTSGQLAADTPLPYDSFCTLETES